jgi:hypothetical protein
MRSRPRTRRRYLVIEVPWHFSAPAHGVAQLAINDIQLAYNKRSRLRQLHDIQRVRETQPQQVKYSF